jgi:hypothetical protein
MKSFLILVLIAALAGVLFFTRPTKADFEAYVKNNTTIVNGKATGGPSVMDKIGAQLKTLVANKTNETAADLFLGHCTYENYWLWTNVKYDGQLIYTGMVGHWFERGSGEQKQATPGQAA